MNNLSLKSIIEALLVSADKPLSIENMLTAFESREIPTKVEILDALSDLSNDYAQSAMELKCINASYSVQTKAQFSPWITRMMAEKPPKYSRALLETLAIIAYQQPATRADIEAIRGVGVNPLIIKTLLEREWIQQAGVRDVPGRPAVYVTTDSFLQYFNLSSLQALPSLEMIS